MLINILYRTQESLPETLSSFGRELYLRVELRTSSLPRKRSTTELIQHCCFAYWSGRRGSNPRPSAWKANALSTELLPQFLWAKMDSNHRRRKPADLQSAPFGHSGNHPCFRASCRIRTNDPEITNHVLWPTELKRQAGELTPSHRSTRYPCFGQDLGDLRGAGREGLTRCKITTFFLFHQIFFISRVQHADGQAAHGW